MSDKESSDTEPSIKDSLDPTIPEFLIPRPSERSEGTTVFLADRRHSGQAAYTDRTDIEQRPVSSGRYSRFLGRFRRSYCNFGNEVPFLLSC